MTESIPPAPGTSTSTSDTAPLPTRPPLCRPRDGRVIGGVAAGIGRWLSIDPVIVRVVLVVLAIFGGSGLLFYAAGWLLIPEDGAPVNEAQKLLAGSGRPGSAGRVALIVVAAIVGVTLLVGVLSGGPFGDAWFLGGSGSLLLLVVIGGLVLWLVNRDKAGVPASPSNGAPMHSTTHDTAAATTATETTGYAYGGYGGYPGYVAPVPAPVPPSPPQPRSYLGAATLSLALVVMGTQVMLNVTDAADISAVVVMATGLGILGIGLLVGAVVGRARWLMALAFPLLLVTALTALVPADLRFGDGVGDRAWAPTTPGQTVDAFRLDIGQATLDLTDLVLPPGAAVYPISAYVGIGDLSVVVPEGVRVLVNGTVGVGRLAIEGQPEQNGTDQTLTVELPGLVDPNVPTLDLTTEVGLGNLEVSRA